MKYGSIQQGKPMSKIIQQSTMTNDEYHAHNAIGSSNIKEILQNPYLFAQGIRKEQTAAMVIGSAIHCMVLEPHLFDSDYAIAPQYDGRTKEGKEIKAAFELEAAGKTVLRAEDYETVKNCAEAIMQNVPMFFNSGIAEQPFFGEINGVAVKCKPDNYIEDMGIIVDIKKCSDASKDGFAKACANFGYHISAAHYIDTLRSLRKPAHKFVFVCVEDKEPYMTAVYELCEADINLGREMIAKAIDIYKRIDQYSTPMYRDINNSEQIVQTITLPSWAHYQYA